MAIFKGKIRGVQLQAEDVSSFSNLFLAGEMDGHFCTVRVAGNRGAITNLLGQYGIEDKTVTVQIGNGGDL